MTGENGIRRRLVGPVEQSQSGNELESESVPEIEEIYPQLNVPQKSVTITYFLWFFGGILGFHHYYLRRTEQAIVWFCTFGGFLGTAWVFEFFKIPKYVREANEDPIFVEEFRKRLQTQERPKFSLRRMFFEFIVGSLFASTARNAVPIEEVNGINWSFLLWLTPLANAIGNLINSKTSKLQETN